MSGRHTPGEAWSHHLHGRGPGVPRGRDPEEWGPLVRESCQSGRAVHARIEVAIRFGGIRVVDVLGVDREPGHHGLPQEVTQAKPLVGEARLIDQMFFGPQDRLVVQPPVQPIQGVAHGAGNDLRMPLR